MQVLRILIVASLFAATPTLAQQPSSHARIGQLAELTFQPGSAALVPNNTSLGSVAAWAGLSDRLLAFPKMSSRTSMVPSIVPEWME